MSKSAVHYLLFQKHLVCFVKSSFEKFHAKITVNSMVMHVSKKLATALFSHADSVLLVDTRRKVVRQVCLPPSHAKAVSCE